MDHNWESLSTSKIVSGLAADGQRLLTLFLIDYTELTNEKNLNPSCGSCMKRYHKTWIQKKSAMNNNSKYKLKPKYENITISLNDNYYINNGNITDELGAKLLESKGEKIFEYFPKKAPKVKEEETDAPELKGKRSNKKK